MTRFWLWLWWWVVDPTRFIIAFCWVALIVGILIVEWRRNRRVNAIRAEADPACPRCGYLVIRLDGHICPECGADLHATGVVRRDDPRTSPLAKIALWTLLLGLPAFQGWRYVETRLPVLNERSVTQISSGPSSKAYKSIEARMTGRRWQWSWQSPSPLPLDRLELRLVNLNGAQKIFHTRLAIPSDVERLALTKKVLAATAPVDLPKALNRDEVSRWIADQGIDSNDPQVVAELAEIAKLIDG